MAVYLMREGKLQIIRHKGCIIYNLYTVECHTFGFWSFPFFPKKAKIWSFLDISRISTKPNSTFFYNLQDGLCSHMIRYVGRATVARFSSIWCLKSSISWWKRWFWPASNIFDPKVFSDFDCDKKSSTKTQTKCMALDQGGVWHSFYTPLTLDSTVYSN